MAGEGERRRGRDRDRDERADQGPRPSPRRPQLRARGAEIAIVTRGVHGAALATSTGSWTLGNLPATLRGPYSVGSGDAFLAGFLAGVSRGLPAPDALRLAGAAGAANARTPGQGELDPADVVRIQQHLVVEDDPV